MSAPHVGLVGVYLRKFDLSARQALFGNTGASVGPGAGSAREPAPHVSDRGRTAIARTADKQRTDAIMRGIAGKRLTYRRTRSQGEEAEAA
jgi:hypothetical protein